MVKKSEVTEKNCIKDRYPRLKVKIQIVQDCAAMSAVAEFLLKIGICIEHQKDMRT